MENSGNDTSESHGPCAEQKTQISKYYTQCDSIYITFRERQNCRGRVQWVTGIRKFWGYWKCSVSSLRWEVHLFRHVLILVEGKPSGQYVNLNMVINKEINNDSDELQTIT